MIDGGNNFKLLLQVAERGIASGNDFESRSRFVKLQIIEKFITSPVTFFVGNITGKVGGGGNGRVEETAAEVEFQIFGRCRKLQGFPGQDDFSLPEKSIINLHTDMGFVTPFGIVFAVLFKHITSAAVDGSAEIIGFAAVAQMQFKGLHPPDPRFGIAGRKAF